MSQRECEKHGLTDFTDPDMNNCVMCKLCRDEAIQKFMDKTAPRVGIADAMGLYISHIVRTKREIRANLPVQVLPDMEPLVIPPVFDKDPARKPNG